MHFASAAKQDRKVHQMLGLLPVSQFYIFRQCTYVVYLYQDNNLIVLCMLLFNGWYKLKQTVLFSYLLLD